MLKPHTAAHLVAQSPITHEPLQIGHYVLKGLNPPHSSFNVDLHLLKLKLRPGTLM